MSKKFRLLALCLCVAMMATMLAACGGKTETATSENGEEIIEITVGCWPVKESDPTTFESYEKYKADFEAQYPNIKIKTDEWAFTTDTFLPLAAAGTLPTVYRVPYTEPTKIINSGYARDVSATIKEYGYDTGVNEDAMALVMKDGAYYGLPYSGYMVGMTYNGDLFVEAGLVDENGVPTYPDTWEEAAEMGKIIKEKTGADGISICTEGSWGGWQFLEIAWGYGVEFMKQDENGKWIATFDSPEMIEAMQYFSDLKWKYDILPTNIILDRDERDEIFGKGQLAMMEGGDAGSKPKLQSYGISKDSVGCGPILAGPKGRYSQYGGDVYMFSTNATDAQIDACFKWIEFIGNGSKVGEKYEENLRAELQAKIDDGYGIDYEHFQIWEEGEKNEIRNRVFADYVNVNEKYAISPVTDDTIMMAEPPMCAQQLYSAIGAVMQEVLNNKDADIPALIAQCQKDFQADYLDTAE